MIYLDSDDESKNDNIPTKIESVLKSINTIIATNIKVLFRNKIIEDDVITLLIKICFDSLEISIETKTLQNKDTIFSILQQLIVKFQSNTNIQLILLKLTTKIVNLIYSQEQLVSSLSEFIVLAIKGDSSLNKMAVDIIHEVSKTVFEDTNMDSQGLKNVGKFLVILSEKTAKTMYNNITSLIQLFDSESYVIRNSLVEVIANVIINILCNVDDISDVDTRNNYLKTKENRIKQSTTSKFVYLASNGKLVYFDKYGVFSIIKIAVFDSYTSFIFMIGRVKINRKTYIQI